MKKKNLKKDFFQHLKLFHFKDIIKKIKDRE